MKKTLIAFLALVLSTSAFAQFEEGKKYIATSLSGINLNYSGATKWNFNLDATAGHFLFDDVMFLGILGYNHTSSSDDFRLGLGARYYIVQNGLHVGANVYWNYRFRDGSVSVNKHNFHIGPEIGYTFFLNRNVTIEPAIYYNMSLNDFSNGSEAGLRIGFGFFFNEPSKPANKKPVANDF